MYNSNARISKAITNKKTPDAIRSLRIENFAYALMQNGYNYHKSTLSRYYECSESNNKINNLNERVQIHTRYIAKNFEILRNLLIVRIKNVQSYRKNEGGRSKKRGKEIDGM